MVTDNEETCPRVQVPLEDSQRPQKRPRIDVEDLGGDEISGQEMEEITEEIFEIIPNENKETTSSTEDPELMLTPRNRLDDQGAKMDKVHKVIEVAKGEPMKIAEVAEVTVIPEDSRMEAMACGQKDNEVTEETYEVVPDENQGTTTATEDPDPEHTSQAGPRSQDVAVHKVHMFAEVAKDEPEKVQEVAETEKVEPRPKAGPKGQEVKLHRKAGQVPRFTDVRLRKGPKVTTEEGPRQHGVGGQDQGVSEDGCSKPQRRASDNVTGMWRANVLRPPDAMSNPRRTGPGSRGAMSPGLKTLKGASLRKQSVLMLRWTRPPLPARTGTSTLRSADYGDSTDRT